MSRKLKEPKRTKWTKLEDKIIKESVQTKEYDSDINWRSISDKLTALGYPRNHKQCRDRFVNHLNNINKSKLTEKEILKLSKLQIEYGNSWSRIAKFFTGRSPNQLKNWWHSMERSNVGIKKKTCLQKKITLQKSTRFQKTTRFQKNTGSVSRSDITTIKQISYSFSSCMSS